MGQEENENLKKLYLAYHSVLNQDVISDLPAGIGIRKCDFRINCLAVKYLFIPLYKLIYGKSSNIILTFDDGYCDNFENALEYIEKYSLQAIFFISTSKIGNYFFTPDNEKMPVLNADQLRYCSLKGVIIASHGHEHRYLDMVESSKLQGHLEKSKRLIEEITGKKCDIISYPFGRIDPRVIEIVKKTGFKKGFIVGPNQKTLKNIDDLSGFTIERTAIDGSKPLLYQLLKILPFYNEIRRAVWIFKKFVNTRILHIQ